MQPTHLKSKKISSFGTRLLFGLFFLPFFAVGLVTGYQLLEQLSAFGKMRSWIPTPATLMSAHLEVKTKHTSDGTSKSYILHAGYAYHYMSKSFSSHTAGFDDKGGMGIGLKTREKILLDHIQKQLPFTCYVNPENPVESVLFREILWDKALMWALFCVIFGGVGAGGLYFLSIRPPASSESETLSTQFPDMPWKWQKNWCEGRIYAATKTLMLLYWCVAIFVMALSLPMCLAFKEEWQSGNKLIAIGLIFHAFGLFMIYLSLRKTIQWKKFGKSYFELSENPGIVGGKLTGNLVIPCRMHLLSAPEVTLNCFQTITTGSGKNGSTTKKLLWEEHKTIPLHSLYTSQNTTIPVTFNIPDSCLATNSESKISWELHTSIPVTGVDFEADFEVPVFHASKTLETLNSAHIRNEPNEGISFDPALTKITLQKDTSHDTLIFIPSPLVRHPFMVMGFMVFTLIWSGFLALLIHLKAPVIFPVVWALFDTLFVLILLNYMGVKHQIIISRHTLNLKTHILFFQKNFQVPHQDILNFDVKMHTSSQTGNKHTAYYSLTAHYKSDSGRPKTTDLATFLKSKQEGLWLKHVIIQAMQTYSSWAVHGAAPE